MAGVDLVLASGGLDVKGASPVANSGSLEFAEGLSEAKPLTGDNQNKLDAVRQQPLSDLPSGEPVVDDGTPHQAPTAEAPVLVKRGQKLQPGVGIIDWLSFTLPVPDGQMPADLACWMLGKLPEGATLMDRGQHGYDEGWRLPGGGLVLYHNCRHDMGVHVSLPAGCLALLEGDPMTVIAWVLVKGGHFTRLDVALDTDQVTMEQVTEAVRAGDIVTRCAQIDFVETTRRADEGGWEYGGSIVRIGSRSSRRYIRIYDKAAEQKIDDGSIWTRCEVEFKAQHAQLAALHIAEGADLRSLIYSSVDFRDRSADSNTSRCPQLDWWAAWIGSVGRVSFTIKKTIEDVVDRAMEWVKRQCAPTLAFLDAFKRHDPNWLFSLVATNAHRIPYERRQLLAGVT